MTMVMEGRYDLGGVLPRHKAAHENSDIVSLVDGAVRAMLLQTGHCSQAPQDLQAFDNLVAIVYSHLEEGRDKKSDMVDTKPAPVCQKLEG